MVEEIEALDIVNKAAKLVGQFADISIKAVSVVLINKTKYNLREGFLIKSGCKVEEYKISVEPNTQQIMGIFLSNRFIGCLRSTRVGLLYEIDEMNYYFMIGFACSWLRQNRVAAKIVKLENCNYEIMSEILDKFINEELDNCNISSRTGLDNFIIEATIGESAHTVARFKIEEKKL